MGKGPCAGGLGTEPQSLPLLRVSQGLPGLCTWGCNGTSLGAWAGLSQVQVGVATQPAGPEVHSACAGLYPDAWVSDPLRVPGEPQPELPTHSPIPKTRQAQEAARDPEARRGEMAGFGWCLGAWVGYRDVCTSCHLPDPRPRKFLSLAGM